MDLAATARVGLFTGESSMRRQLGRRRQARCSPSFDPPSVGGRSAVEGARPGTRLSRRNRRVGDEACVPAQVWSQPNNTGLAESRMSGTQRQS